MSEVLETSEKMVWLDVETCGLDSEIHPLLEVGMVVTDLELNPVPGGSFTRVVYLPDLETVVRKLDPFVVEMHSNNGLFAECVTIGRTLEDLDEELSGFIDYHEITGEVLCGSTVSFDRGFVTRNLPKSSSRFHYRDVNISTLKELCRRYNPDLLAKKPETETNHRVINCLSGTILEFKFFLDNFLIEGGR